jgi:cation diffusion facilitator CzcD-associated flavoprotein CzcO
MASSQTVTETTVAIIGGGFSGMCTAIKLKETGIDDFVILEKASEVGGTWRENTYPGLTVDIPSALYSFSFAPNPYWQRTYASRAELFDYARTVADDYGLREHIRFGAEGVGGEFDESAARWRIDVSDGSTVFACFVVLACVSLHFPHIPDIAGRDSFAGKSFHSARWEHEYDLTGKRVAVIGTGASAVQFIPEIAKTAGHVTVYQRSASWVLPKVDLGLPRALHALFDRVPLSQKLVRAGVFGLQELLHVAQFHPPLLGAFEALCKKALHEQVADPLLRKKLTPDYRFSCKRPLISNVYYRAFTRDNVTLHTDAVREIDEHAVVDAAGRRTEVDAIIWGTGFHVQDMYKFFPDITCAGISVRDKVARDGLRSYRGVAMSGFPNAFTVTGANAVLAHTSFLLTIEANVGYIVGLLKSAVRDGVRRIEVTEEAERRFTERAHRKLGEAVWSIGGCSSYFIDERKVNRITWPGSALHQRIFMRTPDFGAYRVERARELIAGRSG